MTIRERLIEATAIRLRVWRREGRNPPREVSDTAVYQAMESILDGHFDPNSEGAEMIEYCQHLSPRSTRNMIGRIAKTVERWDSLECQVLDPLHELPLSEALKELDAPERGQPGKLDRQVA